MRFTKMHGAGNDFVVLDAVEQPLGVAPEDAPTWAEYAVWWVQDELAEIAALDGRGKARAARRSQQAGYGKQAFIRRILAAYGQHAPFAILRAAVQAVFRPGAARGNFTLPLLRQVQKTAVQRDMPSGCALAKLVQHRCVFFQFDPLRT